MIVPLFKTLSHISFMHRFRLRRNLPFCHPGGTLLHEQDLHRGKDNLEILKQAWLSDIHEIQEQFVVGGDVVLAVDLGVAGEAAFGL